MLMPSMVSSIFFVLEH